MKQYKQPKNAKLQIRISSEDKEKLESISQELGWTLNQFINVAIKRILQGKLKVVEFPE